MFWSFCSYRIGITKNVFKIQNEEHHTFPFLVFSFSDASRLHRNMGIQVLLLFSFVFSSENVQENMQEKTTKHMKIIDYNCFQIFLFFFLSSSLSFPSFFLASGAGIPKIKHMK